MKLKSKVGKRVKECLLLFNVSARRAKKSETLEKNLSEMGVYGGFFGYGYDMMKLQIFGYISRSYIHFGKRIYIQIIYPVIGYISWI